MTKKTNKPPARGPISKQHSIHVDDDNWTWLEEYAAQTGQTTSGAFREILRNARTLGGMVHQPLAQGSQLQGATRVQKTGARGIVLPDDSSVEFHSGRGERKKEPGLIDLPRGAKPKRAPRDEEEMDLG